MEKANLTVSEIKKDFQRLYEEVEALAPEIYSHGYHDLARKIERLLHEMDWARKHLNNMKTREERDAENDEFYKKAFQAFRKEHVEPYLKKEPGQEQK